MKLAFIIDPIANLDPTHDSSVAIMEAACQMGHQVYITTTEQLSVTQGRAAAHLQSVITHPVHLENDRWIAPNPWYVTGQVEFQYLDEMNAVFMRTDPPVDVPYIYATLILDYIDPRKTLLINHPNSLRAANEKMFTMQFAEWMTDTIVTRNREMIREFVEKHQAAVMKPLGGKAGEGILFLQPDDRNLNSLVEISTQWGKYPMMVQKFLPAAKDGDKRIIVLDGQPLGAVNRIPTGREFRGNMAVGGRVAAATITDHELQMCAALAPKLKEYGLYFVGIDVIGGYLTEVNVTSPTGIREIDRLNNTSLGKQIISWLAAKIG